MIDSANVVDSMEVKFWSNFSNNLFNDFKLIICLKLCYMQWIAHLIFFSLRLYLI
jgi:heme/copper-type cytochrome/quinol oxidase subunit 4